MIFIDAGFCWSTKTEPTIEDNKLSVYQGDSLISGVITGLKGGNTYYVRAYATNAAVTSYGETREIKTPNIIENIGKIRWRKCNRSIFLRW